VGPLKGGSKKRDRRGDLVRKRFAVGGGDSSGNPRRPKGGVPGPAGGDLLEGEGSGGDKKELNVKGGRRGRKQREAAGRKVV